MLKKCLKPQWKEGENMIEIKPLASGSKGNSYLISDGSSKILIECGIPWKDIQKKLNYKTSEIEGCLISHRHSDHCKSIKDVAKAGINIYLAEEEREAIGIQHHRIHAIEPLKQFKLGAWSVLPFDVNHDTENPLGFLLSNKAGEKLIFITDSYYCKYRFENLNFIMVECNYSLEILEENILDGKIPPMMKKRLLRSHFSLEHVKEFLLANDLSKVQEIWLLHLSDSNSDAELFKKEIQSITGKPVYIA